MPRAAPTVAGTFDERDAGEHSANHRRLAKAPQQHREDPRRTEDRKQLQQEDRDVIHAGSWMTDTTGSKTSGGFECERR